MPSSDSFTKLSCSRARLTRGRSRSVCTLDRAPGLPPHYPRSRWRTDGLWKYQTLGSAAPRPSYRPGATDGIVKMRQERGIQDRDIRENISRALHKTNLDLMFWVSSQIHFWILIKTIVMVPSCLWNLFSVLGTADPLYSERYHLFGWF